MAINIGTIEGVLRLRDELSASLAKAANNIQNTAKFPKLLQASLFDLEKQIVKLSKTPSLRADAITSTKAIALINAQNRALAENIATIKKGPGAVQALNNERDINNRLLAVGVTRQSAFGKQLEASIRTQQQYKQQLADLNKIHKTFAEGISEVGRSLAFYIGPQLIRTITVPIVALGGSIIKLSSDFESSFAGIIKTVDGVTDEFGNLTKFGMDLSQGMRDLSKTIPINVNELNKIGEAAGQLGIKKEAILGFTRTVADLGVTTNLSTDAAATGLAKLANITQLPQDQFDRLGSTIVDLGNKFAATESEILEIGTRIAGAGEFAGLTEAQILSVGTAIISLGVEAEAGGTAVQKVLVNMTKAVAQGNKDLKFFAATAGKSSKEFAELFRRDAGEAFRIFVEGLGQQGQKAFNTLDALHLKDQRLTRAFISLAASGDLLNKTMSVGTKAFADNNALTTEAEKRYKTFASQLTLTWNKIKDIAIELGKSLLPILRDLLIILEPIIKKFAELSNWFNELPTGVQITIISFVALLAAIGPVLYIVGQLLLAWGSILTLAPKLATGLMAHVGPWGAITVAITLATLALVTWIDKWREASNLSIQASVDVGNLEGRLLQFEKSLKTIEGPVTSSTLGKARKDLEDYARELIKAREQFNKTISTLSTAQREFVEKDPLRNAKALTGNKTLIEAAKNVERMTAQYERAKKVISSVGTVIDDVNKKITTSKVKPFELPAVPSKEAETALRRVRETIQELKLEAVAAEEVYKAHARGGEELSKVEKARQKAIEKIIELENLLTRTGQSLTDQQKKDITEALVTTAEWGVELDKLEDAEKEFVKNILKSAKAMREWSAAGQNRKEKIAEQTVELDKSITAIQREINTLNSTSNLKGLNLERALGLAKVEDGIEGVINSIKRLEGETKEAFEVRLKESTDIARETLLSLANTEFAIHVKRYLEEPITEFADTVKSQLSNAITDVIVDGKLDFDDLWKSFLRSALDALQKWIIRYIAVQRIARVEAAKTAAVNAAIGGQAGGVTGITGSTSGAIGMTGSSTATTVATSGGFNWGAAGAAVGWAAVAMIWMKVLSGLYEGFTKGKLKFGEASIEGGASGTSKLSRQIAEVITKLVEDVNKTLEAWNLGVEKLGNISIRVTEKGEFTVRTLIDPVGKMFRSMEEAVEYAKLQAIKLAEFSDSTSALIRAAISGSRAQDVSGLGSDIDFARMLENQNKPDIGQQLSDLLTTTLSNIRRAMDLFRNDLQQMSVAIDSVLTNFLTNLTGAYNSLMGIKEDPKTVWERNKQAYNLQRAIMLAQIALLYEEIKARIALYNTQRLLMQGHTPGTIDRQPPGGGQIDPITRIERNWGTLKGGMNPNEPPPDNRNPSNDPTLRALLSILDNLARAMLNLPPEITGGMPAGAGGGGGSGGGRGLDREALQELITSTRRTIAEAGMTEFERQLASINLKWDEATEGSGKLDGALGRAKKKRDEAILAANGNAEAIARANEQYQKSIRNIGKSSEQLEEANRVRAEEIALLEQQTKIDLTKQFREFLGLVTPFDQVRETAADLIKDIEGSPFGDARKAAMIGRVLADVEKQIDRMAREMTVSLFGQMIADMEKFGVSESVMIEARKAMAIIEHTLKMEHYRAEIEILKASGKLSKETIDLLEGAFRVLEGVDPTLFVGGGNSNVVGGSTAPNYDDGTWAWTGAGWVKKPNTGTGTDTSNDIERARDLLNQYLDQVLDPLTRELNKINEDFIIISGALGNTAEVISAKNDAIRRAIDDFLQPIKDFRTSMDTGDLSTLTAEDQFKSIQDQFRSLSQNMTLMDRDKLLDLAEKYRSLGKDFTAGEGFRFIDKEIKDVIDRFLLLTPGGVGTLPLTASNRPEMMIVGAVDKVTGSINTGNTLLLEEVRKQVQEQETQTGILKHIRASLDENRVFSIRQVG